PAMAQNAITGQASSAFRGLTADFAFQCPDSSSQPLESLQPDQQWHRTPLPVRLPALFGA
ncbi:hypothetical protein, partial [Planococcus donghaensis]|uniref:hypothetical protein n=1 Tax=Planococcus donghaensis TaxID=414778 RepID=UPI003735EE48